MKQRRAVKARGEEGDSEPGATSAPPTPRDALSPRATAADDDAAAAKRPPPTLAGRFFGTVHAPATVHKIKTLLLFDAMPINPRARMPTNVLASMSKAARDATALGVDVTRSARVSCSFMLLTKKIFENFFKKIS